MDMEERRGRYPEDSDNTYAVVLFAAATIIRRLIRMDSFRFRPQVSSLEDRLTPAASAQELIFQSAQAAPDAAFMQDFMATGTRPRSIATLSTLAVQLAGITRRSAENAFEYVEALQG